VGSAEIAYAAVNNQSYTDLTTLVSGNYLDGRFTNTNGFNGYTYASGTVISGVGVGAPPDGFEFLATPRSGGGRYEYGIAPDQVVRYISATSGAAAPAGLNPGDPIGKAQ
jgi:hypothetical protein